MKALALAALLTASLTTGASAACNMLSATPGTWEFDPSTGIWEATTPAKYLIKVRNAGEIYIKATDNQGRGWNEKTISNGQIINGGTISYHDPGTTIRAWDIDNTVNNGNGQNARPGWTPTMLHSYQGFHGPNNNNTALLGTNEEQFPYNGSNPTFKFSRAQVDLLNLTNMTNNDWWIFEIEIDGYFKQSDPNSINTGTNSPNYLMYHTLTCKDGSEHDTENTWGGPGTSFVPPSCTFTNNENGIMDLNPSTGVWTTRTSDPANVSIDFVNIRRIDVDPLDDKIVEVNGPAEYPATINYGGSTVDVAYTGGANPPKLTMPQQTNDSFGFNAVVNGVGMPTSGTIDIEIAGTATPTVPAIYKADTPYRVRHVVTCTQ